MTPSDHDYREYVKKRLTALTSIFGKAVVGDFSQDVKIPAAEDEFTELYAGIQIMLEVIREQTHQLNNKLELKTHRESRLAREKALDEAILESIGEGIIITDRDGVILMVNKALEVMLRTENKEYIGRRWVDVIGAVDEYGTPLPLQNRALATTLRAGRKANGMYNYVRKDGTVFPVSITASPIVFNNMVVGAISVIRDITREREIDRAKSEFVALASHQLRTPQTAIKWYSEMLLNGDLGELDGRQRQFVQEIYDGNQRMVELVNALLNASKIELGQMGHEAQRLDLVEIVESVLGEIQPTVALKGHEVVRNFSHPNVFIHADPRLIRMLIQNLVSNAVKYTLDKGRITIDIRHQNNAVLIVVSDTGIGIPRHQQNKMFSKFFRADNVKGFDTTGSGLGLYINKAIVEQSGGRIWFKSEEHKGTSFYVTLPIKRTIRYVPREKTASHPAAHSLQTTSTNN